MAVFPSRNFGLVSSNSKTVHSYHESLFCIFLGDFGDI